MQNSFFFFNQFNEQHFLPHTSSKVTLLQRETKLQVVGCFIFNVPLEDSGKGENCVPLMQLYLEWCPKVRDLNINSSYKIYSLPSETCATPIEGLYFDSTHRSPISCEEKQWQCGKRTRHNDTTAPRL